MGVVLQYKNSMKDFVKKKWYIFQNDGELRKIITNINWLFLDRVIHMGIAFFVSIIVVRYLGPERYGVLSYASAMVVFFGVFSKLGLDAITVRELVDGKMQKEKLMGTVFFMKLIGGLVAVVLSTVLTFMLKGDIAITFITLLISFSLVFQSTDIIDFWFQSRVLSKYVAYARSGAVILIALIKLYLVYAGAPLAWFAVMISLEAFFVAIGFVIAYLKNKGDIKRWVFDKQISYALLKDAWPLILSAVSVLIYMRIDQVMIGQMLGFEAVGKYSVAVNLSEMWYFIPVIITNSVFPAIIITKKRSKALYYERLQKLYDMMTWMAIAIALPMTFLSGWIIETLYGVEYAQAGSVLAIYVWAGVFVFLGVARSNWIISENLQKYSIFFTGIGAVLNILLNVFLIRNNGIDGAALATLISYSITAIFAPLLFKRTRCMSHMMYKSFFPFKRL